MNETRRTALQCLKLTLTGIAALGAILVLHFYSRGIGVEQVSLVSTMSFPSDLTLYGKLQFPFKTSRGILQNIKNFEGPLVTEEESKKQQKQCEFSFYAQIPIVRDGSLYYFYFKSITHTSAERQIRQALLDVARNSLEPYSKTDTAIFFIDTDQIVWGGPYQKIAESLECAYRGTNGMVPVIGKYFYYKNVHDITAESIKLVSYVANCYYCGSKLCNYTSGLDPMACFLMEEESYPPLDPDSGDQEDLLPLSTVLVPFSRSDLCGISEDVIDVIRHRVYVSSLIPSVGSELWQIIEDITYTVLIQENSTGLFAEVDFRVTNLLSEYDYHCTAVPDSKKIMSTVHVPYLTEKYSRMQYIREGLYVIAEYESGRKALFKILTQVVGIGHAFIQGISEICAHYMDMMLGYYMTPVNVYRRLRMEMDCDPECIKFAPLKSKIEGVHAFDDTLKRTYRFFNQTYRDPETGNFLLNVDVIGWVKDMFERDEVTKTFYRLDEDRRQIQSYFTHDISFAQFKGITQGTTRQDVKDISDIILWDFLIYNYDRAWTTNWARSGPRYMFFDNGGGLDTKLGIEGSLCSRLLHCPRFFCSGNTGKECFTAPGDARLCRFNKHSLVRLKRVGPGLPDSQRLGPRLWNLITQQGWYNKGLREYFGTKDVAAWTDERINYAVNYINECVRKHGTDVFF